MLKKLNLCPCEVEIDQIFWEARVAFILDLGILARENEYARETLLLLSIYLNHLLDDAPMKFAFLLALEYCGVHSIDGVHSTSWSFYIPLLWKVIELDIVKNIPFALYKKELPRWKNASGDIYDHCLYQLWNTNLVDTKRIECLLVFLDLPLNDRPRDHKLLDLIEGTIRVANNHKNSNNCRRFLNTVARHLEDRGDLLSIIIDRIRERKGEEQANIITAWLSVFDRINLANAHDDRLASLLGVNTIPSRFTKYETLCLVKLVNQAPYSTSFWANEALQRKLQSNDKSIILETLEGLSELPWRECGFIYGRVLWLAEQKDDHLLQLKASKLLRVWGANNNSPSKLKASFLKVVIGSIVVIVVILLLSQNGVNIFGIFGGGP